MTVPRLFFRTGRFTAIAFLAVLIVGMGVQPAAASTAKRHHSGHAGQTTLTAKVINGGKQVQLTGANFTPSATVTITADQGGKPGPLSQSAATGASSKGSFTWFMALFNAPPCSVLFAANDGARSASVTLGVPNCKLPTITVTISTNPNCFFTSCVEVHGTGFTPTGTNGVVSQAHMEFDQDVYNGPLLFTTADQDLPVDTTGMMEAVYVDMMYSLACSHTVVVWVRDDATGTISNHGSVFLPCQPR